jgi:hypothetical protein
VQDVGHASVVLGLLFLGEGHFLRVGA